MNKELVRELKAEFCDQAEVFEFNLYLLRYDRAAAGVGQVVKAGTALGKCKQILELLDDCGALEELDRGEGPDSIVGAWMESMEQDFLAYCEANIDIKPEPT